MTATTEYNKWLSVAVWLAYGLTFFPFHLPKEYLFQWAFVVVAFLGIIGVCATAYKKGRAWRITSAVAALALLFVYGNYWVFLTTTARETQPNLASPIALRYIFDEATQIAIHLWGRGARLGALQVIYFELFMPIAQILLLVWVLSDAYRTRRSIEATKVN
jgi:hypothetical protein